MDPHSPNKLFATKYCFLILGDDTSFYFLIISLVFRLFFFFLLFFVILLLLFFTKTMLFLSFYLINFVFMKLTFIFSCFGMFRVPGFIDAHLKTIADLRFCGFLSFEKGETCQSMVVFTLLSKT